MDSIKIFDFHLPGVNIVHNLAEHKNFTLILPINFCPVKCCMLFMSASHFQMHFKRNKQKLKTLISFGAVYRDQAWGRLWQNSPPRGQNFALNGIQGEVGVSFSLIHHTNASYGDIIRQSTTIVLCFSCN